MASLFTVKMPAKDKYGNLVPGENGLWYCDANQVGGSYCPEFDIMVANRYALQTNPHLCDAPNEHGYYDRCERAGSCW